MFLLRQSILLGTLGYAFKPTCTADGSSLTGGPIVELKVTLRTY